MHSRFIYGARATKKKKVNKKMRHRQCHQTQPWDEQVIIVVGAMGAIGTERL